MAPYKLSYYYNYIYLNTGCYSGCACIAVPPKLVEGLRSSDGVEGIDLHLSCKADGLPAPAFKFYKVQWLHSFYHHFALAICNTWFGFLLVTGIFFFSYACHLP